MAELGVYRDGCSFMLLSTVGTPERRRHWLLDTFGDIRDRELTESERAKGLAGPVTDTSQDHVDERLAPWREHLELVESDMFETLPRTETGALSFVHLDLHVAAPTGACPDYIWPCLMPDAVGVLDDYGCDRYVEQPAVIDGFLDWRPETVPSMPAGQGIVIKR